MKTLLSCVLLSSVVAIAQTPAPNPWKAVDDALGRPGQDQPSGDHKYAMPRGDLKVTAKEGYYPVGLAR